MEEKKPNINLRRQRELRGWSQQTLAALIETNEQVVSRWEKGNHKPSKHFQTKLCQLFGKTALELGFLEELQTTEEEEEAWIDTTRDKDTGTPLFIPRSNIVTPIHTSSASPLLERLSWALTRPASMDEKVIKYLEGNYSGAPSNR